MGTTNAQKGADFALGDREESAQRNGLHLFVTVRTSHWKFTAYFSYNLENMSPNEDTLTK